MYLSFRDAINFTRKSYEAKQVTCATVT